MANPIDMSVIQEAIDRRRAMAAPVPALDQTTGAAAPPGQGMPAPAGPATPSPVNPASIMAQRAGLAGAGVPTPTTPGAPTAPTAPGAPESPDETRLIAKLLIERLRKLL